MAGPLGELEGEGQPAWLFRAGTLSSSKPMVCFLLKQPLVFSFQENRSSEKARGCLKSPSKLGAEKPVPCLRDPPTPPTPSSGQGAPPPGHFPQSSTPPPRAPLGPSPSFPQRWRQHPAWLGPKPSPGNWVSGMLMLIVMLMVGH